MRIKSLLVVAACCLTACVVEQPAESDPEIVAPESDPVVQPGPSFLEPGINHGIVPGDPAWAVESWTRLRVGDPAPTRDNLLGTVAVILCFQHW